MLSTSFEAGQSSLIALALVTVASLARHGGGRGDLFRTLGPATIALDARLDLADAASATLDVQYYGFHHDESGRALLERLAAAAARGVAVRLLLDAARDAYGDPSYQTSRHAANSDARTR